jgi:hypothetical protein
VYEQCTEWTDFVWCIFHVLLSGSRDLSGLYSTSFVGIGSLVFVNSIEYRVMNIDVIVIEVFVLFKRAKDKVNTFTNITEQITCFGSRSSTSKIF